LPKSLSICKCIETTGEKTTYGTSKPLQPKGKQGKPTKDLVLAKNLLEEWQNLVDATCTLEIYI
jgi:hypothetical protein